jgi:hydrogenase small subunit
MSNTLYWLQCGGCGGDTWSLLNAEYPNFIELVHSLDIQMLWHPTLSVASQGDQRKINQDIETGACDLDILCIEGSILRGPGGTGKYDEINGIPKKNLVATLAKRARFILAVGTCASFGGIGANTEIEAVGLQYLKGEKGGFLGGEFTSGSVLSVPCRPSFQRRKLSWMNTRLPLNGTA